MTKTELRKIMYEKVKILHQIGYNGNGGSHINVIQDKASNRVYISSEIFLNSEKGHYSYTDHDIVFRLEFVHDVDYWCKSWTTREDIDYFISTLTKENLDY